MTKSDYIKAISQRSDQYGNLLLEMMDEYNLPNLQEATLEQLKEYWEKVKDKKIKST